jgi:hypothetical protein
MATQKELKDLCHLMFEILSDSDLTNSEALEIALNFYGTVCVQTDVTVHDAVGGVMTFYKKQHANS